MGPGPIFCCYALKLRISSFLQNGAWPHLFPDKTLVLNIATSYHGNKDAYIGDSQLDISIFKSIIIHDKAISSIRKIF
jgi:hypothetical protein